MLCIHLKNQDPYFCLAAEEYLLKKFNAEIFLLWQSHDTIVVGKHQCAMGEINYPFVRENNITVARRISGGGTVFHDSGNVNFSFIKNVESPSEISFKKFTEPIVESLSRLHVAAVNSGRNDLLVEGKKISGNAEHIYKNRVLHHGTLLFNSDLQNLGKAIKVVPGKYETKAVQSNRSAVANISAFLQPKMSLNDFIAFLFEVQLKKPENKTYELNDDDVQNINQLVEEKFSTYEWNFGYSPKYTFRNEKEIEGKKLKIELKIEKGIILESAISGNFFSENDSKIFAGRLKGKKHVFGDLSNEFKSLPDSLVYAFF
ncbi:MAG TPA: lipoate--protein ligase [Prolixibacteraceae bacterium]|nr:lipoate--protein ligase [Prolixibacteraceae bacterium]